MFRLPLQRCCTRKHCYQYSGTMFRSRHPEDKFIWTIPDFLQIFFGETDEKTEDLLINCPCFSKFNKNWRLTLRRYIDQKLIQLLLWKVPSFEFAEHSDSYPDLSVKMGLISTNSIDLLIEDDLHPYGHCNSMIGEEIFENSARSSDDGCLRVFCEMRPKAGTVQDDSHTNADRLVQDLKNLLLNEQFSDLVLKVEGREFKVHRCILAARSPVFAASLQPHTKEYISGVIEIPDCSAEMFDIFLSFIYTGRIESYESMIDLYYAADKYQIIDLKAECAEHIGNSLSVENFCNIMILSYKHSDLRLQKEATDFFIDNVKEILKSDQWMEYVKNYPEQANELYKHAVNA